MIDTLANLFFDVFGNGVVLAIIVIAFITIWLLSVRAPMGIILMVDLPLILGMSLAHKSTNFIYMTAWIVIPIIIMAALFFGFLFLKALRN